MSVAGQVLKPSEVLPAWEGRLVSFDTETTGLHVDDGDRVAVVSVAWFDDDDPLSAAGIRAVAFPFEQGLTEAKTPIAQGDLFEKPEEINLDEAEWDYLLAWLEKQWLTAHNIKFDLHMMREGTNRWSGVDLEPQMRWCSQVAQSIIDPVNLLGLEDLDRRLQLSPDGEQKARSLRAIKSWLSKRKYKTHRYDLAPWYLLEDYARWDAWLHLRLWQQQMELCDYHLVKRNHIEEALENTRVLYRIEKRGIPYDAEESRRMAELCEKRKNEIAKELPFRATLPAAKSYFFGDGGRNNGLNHLPYKLTDKGGVALDDEVLRKMIGDEITWAAEWGEWTELDNAVSMWYRGYADRIGPDGRLRTNFRQTKVKSGRKSVERVNLQAIPKEPSPAMKKIEGLVPVRGLIRARPGWALYNLDLQQAELRVAAVYARCRLMLQMLAEGVDMHGKTCQEIMGLTPDAPTWKKYRDISKRLNFGGIFLIGGKKFQATLSKDAAIDLPLEECESIVYGWRRLYPEYKRAYNNCEAEVESTGGVRIMLGTEYERISRFKPMDYAHTGWSRRVQGSLALFLDIWLNESERFLQQTLNCKDGLILTVHDSQVLELPESEGAEIAAEVAAIGAKRGTELFGISMGVDVSLWEDK